MSRIRVTQKLHLKNSLPLNVYYRPGSGRKGFYWRQGVIIPLSAFLYVFQPSAAIVLRSIDSSAKLSRTTFAVTVVPEIGARNGRPVEQSNGWRDVEDGPVLTRRDDDDGKPSPTGDGNETAPPPTERSANDGNKSTTLQPAHGFVNGTIGGFGGPAAVQFYATPSVQHYNPATPPQPQNEYDDTALRAVHSCNGSCLT